MDKNFKVEVYTPYGKYLATTATYLSTVTPKGVMGVMPNHAPLISTLEISRLVIKNDNKETLFAISGGVINIKKDHSVVLLVNSIERKDEIDVDRAKKAKLRAEERLSANKNDIDIARAKAALARALVRLSITDKE